MLSGDRKEHRETHGRLCLCLPADFGEDSLQRPHLSGHNVPCLPAPRSSGEPKPPASIPRLYREQARTSRWI